METRSGTFVAVFSRLRKLLQQLLIIGENRLELWLVEVQEQRENLFRFVMIGVGAAFCGLLAAMALSGAIIVLLWPYSPLVAFIGVGALFSLIAAALYHRLASWQRDWRPLPETIDQLRKDRLCLEKTLS